MMLLLSACLPIYCHCSFVATVILIEQTNGNIVTCRIGNALTFAHHRTPHNLFYLLYIIIGRLALRSTRRPTWYAGTLRIEHWMSTCTCIDQVHCTIRTNCEPFWQNASKQRRIQESLFQWVRKGSQSRGVDRGDWSCCEYCCMIYQHYFIHSVECPSLSINCERSILTHLKLICNKQAAWSYYENRSNGEEFSSEERGKWNKDKKWSKWESNRKIDWSPIWNCNGSMGRLH